MRTQGGATGGGASAPTAAATSTPANLSKPGSLVTLSAATSTGTGVLSYVWTLHGPDGIATSLLSSTTNVAPTYTPATFGSYGATVAVTDSTGSASATTFVQVGATNRASAQFLIYGARPVTRVARTAFINSVFSITT